MPTLEDRRAAIEARFPVWEEHALGDWVRRCAQQYAERPLVIAEDRTLTYAEVDEWSDRLADGLVALGVRPGEHVGIVLANHAEFVPLKFAVAKAGAVAVPMNFLYREDEWLYVLAQSESRVLVTMTGFAGLDHLGMLDRIAPGWEAGTPAALPLLRDVVQIRSEGELRDGVRTLDDLAALGDAHAGASRGIAVDPRDVGDILYTSGTTGSPKGVMVAHDAVLRTAYGSALTRAFDDGWRTLFSLPCYHMFGYVEGVLAVTMVGGSVVMQTRFDPAGYLRGVAEHGADDILCVPTMTVALLEHPGRAAHDLSSLRAVLSGSAPGPTWLWERVARDLGATEIVTGYGMTETGGAQTLTRPEDPFELTATTVGRTKAAGVAGLAAHGGALTEYRTADPLTGAHLPAGEEGELISRGPTNMLGFWNKPEETALGLRGGWVHSGDLGRVLEDGSLVITGRSKELYKSGGELVMPKEIEELLAAHPDVSQVYAVGVVDERWGEIGCACVVRTPDGTITEAEVIELCRANLARFKVPKLVRFLEAEALPTTPTGKIQKFRLVRMVEEERRAAAGSGAS